MQSKDQVFDELLVLECQQGNRKAMELLVKRWYPKLMRQAVIHTRDIEISRDIVQESWHSVFRGIQSLKDAASFPVWINRIVRARSVDFIRDRQKKRKTENEWVSLNENTNQEEDTELMTKMRVALRFLKEEEYSLIDLYYNGGYGVKQIGRIMSVPPGTIKSRLFYARRKLLNHIKK